MCVMAFIIIMIGLGYAFFPEFVEFFELDKQAQDAVMANNPESAISRPMFLSAIALTSVACIAIGWIVVRTAPFAPFPHAVFLAALIFIYFLQMALADPPLKKSMTLAYMIAFPIAILIGARWADSRQWTEEDSTLDSLGKNVD